MILVFWHEIFSQNRFFQLELRPIFLHREFQNHRMNFIFLSNERYMLCGAQKNAKSMSEHPEKTLLERLF